MGTLLREDIHFTKNNISTSFGASWRVELVVQWASFTPPAKCKSNVLKSSFFKLLHSAVWGPFWKPQTALVSQQMDTYFPICFVNPWHIIESHSKKLETSVWRGLTVAMGKLQNLQPGLTTTCVAEETTCHTLMVRWRDGGSSRYLWHIYNKFMTSVSWSQRSFSKNVEKWLKSQSKTGNSIKKWQTFHNP